MLQLPFPKHIHFQLFEVVVARQLQMTTSNYEPGATLLNFSDRADTDETMQYSVYKIVGSGSRFK